MADIFISYKREDTLHAQRLAAALTQLGFEVWYDFELLSGDRYRRVIRQIIDQCHVAIVLWSGRSIESDFVVDEASYGKSQGKLCPVLIEPVEIPFGFGSVHTDILVNWNGEMSHDGFSRLLRSIETRVGRKATLGAPNRTREQQQVEAELESFKTAQLAGNASALRNFVSNHPTGRFASFVRDQISSMEATVPPITVAPAPAVAASSEVTPEQAPQPVIRPSVGLKPKSWWLAGRWGLLAGSVFFVMALKVLDHLMSLDASVQASATKPVDKSVAESDLKKSTTTSIPRAWLGVHVQSVDAQAAEVAGSPDVRGAYIVKVNKGSPAEKAGLRLADVIHIVNGTPVADAPGLIQWLGTLAPGADLAIQLKRAGNWSTVNARMAVRPDEAEFQARTRAEAPTEVTVAKAQLTVDSLDLGRWTRLSFYPNTQLWELGRYGSDATISYLVPTRGAPIFLGGTSSNIHHYNTQVNLNLNNLLAAGDYLRFFSSYVWGEAGPFRIIERAEDLPAKHRGEFAPLLKPMSIQQASQIFEAQANVLYGNVVFAAKFKINPTGMVEMVDDKPLSTTKIDDQPIYANGQRRPANIEGLKVGDWPLPPVIRGDWRNATSEEAWRVRHLILTDLAR
jgi:TIR domain/PDZ domain